MERGLVLVAMFFDENEHTLANKNLYVAVFALRAGGFSLLR